MVSYFGLSGWERHHYGEGVDDEITGKRDTSLFGNRRGNCLGANLRPGPDGPTGNIAHECGAEEYDFKILQRSGQCQRTARQGAVEIQIRVQEGRRQGRVTAGGGTGGLASHEPPPYQGAWLNLSTSLRHSVTTAAARARRIRMGSERLRLNCPKNGGKGGPPTPMPSIRTGTRREFRPTPTDMPIPLSQKIFSKK